MNEFSSVTLDDRVAEVLTWFDGDPKDFPSLGVVYFEEPDTVGHKVGPVHPEVLQQLLLLPDLTNGCAYATMLRPSVVCYVAKWCVLPKNCPKKQIGNDLWGIEWQSPRGHDTWPWKAKIMTPIYLWLNISKTAGDGHSVTNDNYWIMYGWTLLSSCLVYSLLNPQRRRTTCRSLHPRVHNLQLQIMLVISLTVTLLSECYLKTSTGILRQTTLYLYLSMLLANYFTTIQSWLCVSIVAFC